tara:strand:+ start:4983 stop:6098 length:1116 start_codon:yes stop_codon:yes gene_type:complete
MAFGNLKVQDLIYEDGANNEVTVVISELAPKASPTLSGVVTIPTPTAGDNSTKAASTAFVATSFAPLADPTLTGTVTIPTATAADNSTKAASTAYVQTELGSYAPLAAPAFTGNATGVNLTLSGNLTVNGTTTSVNTTNLEVEDKNIELGKVTTPSDQTADGGGITLKGATDKTIVWTESTNSWDFNQKVKINAGTVSEILVEGSTHGSIILRDNNATDVAARNFEIISTDENLKIRKLANDFSTPTVFLTIAKTGNATFSGTVSDSKGDLRTIVQLDKNGQHAIVNGDSGKHSINQSGGWILNDTSNFTAGQAITLINKSNNNQTIMATNVTLYNTANGQTGNRTLAAKGMATILCTEADVYYISGSGLT